MRATAASPDPNVIRATPSCSRFVERWALWPKEDIDRPGDSLCELADRLRRRDDRVDTIGSGRKIGVAALDRMRDVEVAKQERCRRGRSGTEIRAPLCRYTLPSATCSSSGTSRVSSVRSPPRFIPAAPATERHATVPGADRRTRFEVSGHGHGPLRRDRRRRATFPRAASGSPSSRPSERATAALEVAIARHPGNAAKARALATSHAFGRTRTGGAR